jgi:hypothetical protein
VGAIVPMPGASAAKMLEAPHAAAGAHVHVVHAPGRQLLRAADVIDVVGVAAVDEDVARLEVRDDGGDGLVHHRGGDHQPDRTGLRELAREILERCGTRRLVLHQVGHRLRRAVEDDAVVPPSQQAPHHVGAHPAKTDHSELHDEVLR